MTENTTSTINELSDKRPEGTRLGQDAEDKISFFGATPVVQPADASQAQVTMSSAKTTTQLRTDIDKVADLANKLQAALVTEGLIKGSA